MQSVGNSCNVLSNAYADVHTCNAHREKLLQIHIWQCNVVIIYKIIINKPYSLNNTIRVHLQLQISRGK